MKDIQEKIIRFCFEEAMQDATNRVYTRPKDFEDRKGRTFRVIFDFITQIENQELNKQEDFDKLFYSLCENVCKAMNEKYDKDNKDRAYFTFGKAQKLINMTFKYFAISMYFDKNNDIKNIFIFCHCPIDSIISEKIIQKEFNIDKNPSFFNKNGKLNRRELKKNKKEINDIFIKIDNISKSNKDEIWSTITKEDYENIQKEIKKICDNEGVYPIEFDFMNWEKK